MIFTRYYNTAVDYYEQALVDFESEHYAIAKAACITALEQLNSVFGELKEVEDNIEFSPENCERLESMKAEAQLKEEADDENIEYSRDGTTRKKQKIVDTSVTLDLGDVMSLGFTRVASETAETIQSVTQNQMIELGTFTFKTFLEQCEQSPEILLQSDRHWTENDPLEISIVQQNQGLTDCLFTLHEDIRELMFTSIPIVAKALLKTVNKQLVGLEVLAYFTHKVTLPFLYFVEVNSQQELLKTFPQLYTDLLAGKRETLKDYVIHYPHIPVVNPTSALSKKILQKMCTDAAEVFDRQAGREYGFRKYRLGKQPRATEL
ncbi:hypothetical protein GQR58_025470 [Nymphon striatum]|nr:hypothetical protein GQR58_025470 [Nymphon striatum]